MRDFIDLCHADWCKMKSQPGFDLHFLMTKDAKHFFMYFSVICISFFDNSLFTSVSHFKNWVVCFLASFLSYTDILDISPL